MYCSTLLYFVHFIVLTGYFCREKRRLLSVRIAKLTLVEVVWNFTPVDTSSDVVCTPEPQRVSFFNFLFYLISKRPDTMRGRGGDGYSQNRDLNLRSLDPDSSVLNTRPRRSLLCPTPPLPTKGSCYGKATGRQRTGACSFQRVHRRALALNPRETHNSFYQRELIQLSVEAYLSQRTSAFITAKEAVS